MNRTGSTILRGLLLATSGLVGSTVLASTAAMAGGGPTGGTVAVGSATIVNSSPTQTVVNQSSQKALINWNSFSIPGGSSVQFKQPNSKSLTVNRVTGANASIIDGQILATGNVWLINANGVLFGKGSQINVGALLATTSDLSDDDFKNGNYNFKPAANPNAAVVNKGTITAGANGSVVLSAPRVSNEGLISADFGTVVLGGANAFTVDMTGDNLLRYEITAPVTSAPRDASGNLASALVSNAGTIEAAGGHVMMTARAARNIENNVINNTGMVEATSVSAHNGVIDLDAGPDGTVNDSGTLNASGTAQGQTGGAVNVTGGTVNIADGAKIDASGNAGGGTIQIGGGLHGGGTLAHAQTTIIGKATISTDATGNGNGGTVAVWSDGDTSFAGSISAKGGAQGGNGGQVETSGHNLGVAASAKVDTSAPLGLTGDWLLDPTDLFITSNTTMTVSGIGCPSTCVDSNSISSSLATSDVTSNATHTLTLDANSNITWNSAHSLTLLAGTDMTIKSSIQSAGTGNVTLVAGWDGTTNIFSPTMAAGVYGHGDAGNITLVSGAGNIAVGSAGGQTIVAGYNIELDAPVANTVAQIGFYGAGGGNIAVLATNNLTLDSGEGHAGTEQIGNGAMDGLIAGDVTGDIYLDAGGSITINNCGTVTYLGNTAANGSNETGDVTLITNGGNIDGNFLTNDLGTTAGTGGNVFIGFTGTTGDYSWEAGDYTSANTFTIAAAANLTIKGDIANGGSGNVNVIAGWDGHTTDLTQLTAHCAVAADCAYGQNLGVLTIGGTGATGSVAVGSAGGVTTVAGDNVSVDAENGDAQIGGVFGSGGGDINVLTTSDLQMTANGSHTAWVGNVVSSAPTGDVTLDVGGSISLDNEGGTISFISAGDLAINSAVTDIGTPSGTNSDTFEAGDTITIGAAIDAGTQTLILHAGERQGDSIAGAILDPGGFLLTADTIRLVNDKGGTADQTVGTAADPIQISANYLSVATATDDIYISATGDVDIGDGFNGIYGGNLTLTASGNITQNTADSFGIQVFGLNVTTTGANHGIALTDVGGQGDPGNEIAGSVSLNSAAGLSFTNTETTTLTNAQAVGNIILAADGSLTVADGANISAGGNTELLATGSIDVESSIQNSGSGNVSLVAGWDMVDSGGSTDLNAILTNGWYGGSGNNIAIGDATTGNVSVGSKSGATTILGGDIEVAGDVNSVSGKYAQIGYHGTGGGDIVIFGTGNLSMSGNASQTGQIGNGGFNGTGIGTGAITGDITITVAGNITDNSTANTNWIGNVAKGGSVESGDVTLSMFSGTFNGLDVKADLGTTSGTGGNVFLGFTSTDDTPFAGIGSYNSVNAFTVASAGNLLVEGNIQNSGSGAINLIGGWDGFTADGTLFTNPLTYGIDGNGVTFGSGTNSVAVGGNGIVTVEGGDIELDGGPYTTQLGYAGNSGGDITVRARDTLALYGGEGLSNAVQIGNGATFGSAAAGGNIAISAASIDVEGEQGIAGNSASISTFGGDIGGYNNPLAIAVNYLALPDVENDGGSANAFISSSGPISIGYGGNGIQLLYGGDLTLSAGGAVSQTAAIAAGGVNITATGGDITLNSASNKIGEATLSSSAGNVTIYDGTDLVLDGATVGGNFTALATGNLTITDSIELNSGSLVAIAGWDGTTTDFTSLSASSNAYGQNSGDVVIGGEDAEDDVYVGSKTGTTLIAGANVSVLAVNGNATIGYGGPGGGDITVWAKNDITATGGDDEDPEYENYFGSIGNGDGFTAGDVTGDIAITAGGTTTIVENNGGYVGNFAAEGSSSTGNVTIITNSGELDGGYFQDDLNGGNVFVGFTGTTGTYDLGGLGTYNSSHTFTWAAAASLDVEGNVQNTGSGAVNLIAGWDGHTTDLGSLTNTGVYGNNSGQLSIFAGEGNVIVGSKSGATTVEGAEVDVGAIFGDTAQIGYHGAGATGAITVLAVNDINITGGEGSAAQIGNGGANVTGSVGGNITVSSSSGSINIGDNGGGSLMLIGNVVNSGAASGNIAVSTNGGSVNITAVSAGEIAQIGNLGFSNASEAGNITINTHGQALTVSSSTSGNISVAAFARIGNWTDGDTTLGSSGNIAIAAGAVGLSATGSYGFAEIGNGDFHAGHTGTLSGNIAINAASLSLSADNADGFTQARIGNLGDGTVSGDITVNTTGSVLLTAANGSLVNIGDLSATLDSHGNPAQGAGSGNITVQAGGSISLLALTSGEARIESSDFTSGNVTVTASGNITLSAASASSNPLPPIAFIGSYGTGNDAVNVSVTSLNGAIVLTAAAANGQVGIGTQSSVLAGNISGQVRVSAANTANGNITVSATGAGAAALIGNAGYGSAVSGDIAVLAGNALQIVSVPGVSQAQIGNTDSDFGSPGVSGSAAGNVTVMGGTIDGIENSIENDIVGGNVTIGVTKAGSAVTIDDEIDYSSANALTVLAAGSIILSGDVQNSGTGNITIVTGWNPSVAPSSVPTTAGAYGNNNGSLTIGGSTATGNSALGSAGGTTTILTKNLNVTAVNGVAALGYAGAGHGNIAVSALGNIAVVGKSSSIFAEIGNVGISNQTVSGNITIADAGSVTLTNGILGNAVLGNAAATGNTGLTAASFAVSGTSLLSGSSADITLTSAGAGLGSAGNALNTTVGAIAVQTNNGSAFIAAPKNALSIGIGSRGINLGTGSLTLATGGAITQTAAIKAAAINLSATSGPISLANAANAFGTIVLSTNGSATIGDSSSLTVAGATVGGDLTLLSKGNLIFTQSIQLLKGALVAVAGWNGSGTTAASGTYGNNGGSITIGGSGASGGVAVGSASGAATLAGASINLQAANGYAQIGYHGGGSGAIKVLATNGVTLAGGNSSNFFAQIGDGGFNVTGSSSAPITVQAGGDVALNAGAGQEAYAQIGNGGAESNSNSSGYSETGLVTVSGETVTLKAGGGSGSYAQIGHGGYKSGQSLNGIATLGGDISVNAANAIQLVGGGDDAYAQIGHGGDFLNNAAANGASGALSGNITVNVVAASTPSGGDPLTLTAGTGANSYTQIGNGGQGENSHASGATVTFDIGGNVTVADLTLTGSNTGTNGYSQIGNGDASKTGTGDVSGQVTLGSGTDITNVPGSAPGSSTGLGNSTGFGTVTGTILPGTGIDAGTQGSVASITQNPVGPTNFSITTVTVTPVNTPLNQLGNTTGPQGPTPLEQLSDQSDQEGKTASDSVAQSVGQSLGDGKTIYVTSKTLIPGMLKQIVTLTRNSPNGIPPADEDYSSWGNEALWRW